MVENAELKETAELAALSQKANFDAQLFRASRETDELIAKLMVENAEQRDAAELAALDQEARFECRLVKAELDRNCSFGSPIVKAALGQQGFGILMAKVAFEQQSNFEYRLARASSGASREIQGLQDSFACERATAVQAALNKQASFERQMARSKTEVDDMQRVISQLEDEVYSGPVSELASASSSPPPGFDDRLSQMTTLAQFAPLACQSGSIAQARIMAKLSSAVALASTVALGGQFDVVDSQVAIGAALEASLEMEEALGNFDRDSAR